MGWTDSKPDWERFIGALSPGPGEKILDLGAGAGNVAALVFQASNGAEIYAADPRDERISRAKTEHPSIRSSVAGAEKLPYPDSNFDKVYTTMALHHFADLDASLREVARVLKRGGSFVILEVEPRSRLGVLFRFFGRLRGEHMKMMSQEELVKRIDALGLFRLRSSFIMDSGYLLLLTAGGA